MDGPYNIHTSMYVSWLGLYLTFQADNGHNIVASIDLK